MSRSSSSKGPDLLVRVRYLQSLPAPPFPPKLLTVPTSLSRFAAFETTKALNDDRDLPMNAGSDLGMPLDLTVTFPGVDYWEQKSSNRADHLPQEDVSPFLESEDEELLGELPTSSNSMGSALAGKSTQATGIMTSSAPAPSVSWLRRTEYGSSSYDNRTSQNHSPASTPRRKESSKRLSRQDRINAINATFEASNSPLETLKHPINAHKIAESEHALLPDSELWGTTYSFYRYPDNPSVKDTQTNTLEDVLNGPGARTESALLRFVTIPEEGPRIVYYLSPNESAAQAYRQRKLEKERVNWSDSSNQILDNADLAHTFEFVRDYEPTTRQLRQEFVLMLDDGPTDANPTSKQRGAYYLPIPELHQLRKRRRMRGEDPLDYGAAALAQNIDSWDRIAVQLGINPAPLLDWEYIQSQMANFAEPLE